MMGLKLFISVVHAFAFIACSARPLPTSLGTQQIEPPRLQATGAEQGLWFALSDYRSRGEIARLDLSSGEIRYNIHETGRDVHLVAEKDRSGFFLLTRNGGDSITKFSGRNGAPERTFGFENLVNPQSAARDRHGRVWVVHLDRNSVDVLAPDLSARIASISLQVLHGGGTDSFAELYDLQPSANGEEMLVVAARVDRPEWKPQDFSRIAWVNVDSLAITAARNLTLANATQILAVGDEQLVLGSGAQDSATPISGGFERLGINRATEENSRLAQARVIHGASDSSGRIAWIEWNPQENKSCLRLGQRRLTCAASVITQGFLFYRVAISGERLFAAYSLAGRHELWVMDLGTNELKRYPMSDAIVSMVPGP